METTTLTMAGLLADAGAARLRASAPVSCSTGSTIGAFYGATAEHQVIGNHQSSTWTPGAVAEPTTFMVLDPKNRLTRPLSELSP
jgi:hypothetical protein